MSLILAVEPDRRRGRQLASLVRRYTNAEIVVAQSGAAAISAIGSRVPDLILTPPLLPTQDDAKITHWLRELGDAAAHVQTLAVPILSEGDAGARDASGGSGIFGKLLDRGESQGTAGGHGCDPSVFADQIKVYLERSATDRAARTGGQAPAANAPAAPVLADPAPAKAAAERAPKAAPKDDFDFEDISLDSLVLEPLFIESPAAPSPERPDIDRSSSDDDAVVRKEGAPTASAKPRKAVDRAATRAWERELGITNGTPTSPALWRVSEGLPDEPSEDPVYEATSIPEAVASVPDVDVAVSVAAKRRGRSTKEDPAADTWAFFDPAQTRFAALIKRLDEFVAQHSRQA